MTQQHPITPPPELVQKWFDQTELATNRIHCIAIRAAQWGADQELDACCGLLIQQGFDVVDDLRAARRKPPSLKEQAQAELKRLIALIPTEGAIAMAEPIRRALEQLDD